jgi:hypothetical protein
MRTSLILKRHVSIYYKLIIVLALNLFDGSYQVKIYTHLLDLTRNGCEKCNYRSLAGIESVVAL